MAGIFTSQLYHLCKISLCIIIFNTLGYLGYFSIQIYLPVFHVLYSKNYCVNLHYELNVIIFSKLSGKI